jgi:hypothetical protein
MASLPIRDAVGDHLLTPQNSALVVIVGGGSAGAVLATRLSEDELHPEPTAINGPNALAQRARRLENRR